MLPYFLVFIISVIFASVASIYQPNVLAVDNINIKKNNSYNFFIIVITIILIGFVGLRFDTGADFGNYTNMYLLRKEKPLSEILWMDNSPINNILIKFSKFIYDDSAVYFLIYALIPIALQMHQIKKHSTDIVFSICIYFLAGTVTGLMGAMRQYLAASVLFFGHNYILDRKFFKYLLTVILASMCHITALIMLPVYFISNLKINFKSISLMLIITVVMSYSYDFFFRVMGISTDNELDRYSYLTTEVNSLRILVTIAPIILYLVFASKCKYTEEENFYLLMMFLNAAFMISTSQSAYLARIGIYTSIYSVFSYPILLKNFEPKSKRLMKAIIVAFFLIYFYNQIVTANLSSYKTIFAK